MQIQPLDIFWILFSATLVLLMQAGFLCLESGVTRSKNAINVAMKNSADLLLAFVLFWAVGFGLMFGSSIDGLIGGDHFFPDFGAETAYYNSFFLFQSMFCATAATIVSGAIAERVGFNGYLLLTAFIVSVIYPVSGHWAWGGAISGASTWLADLGFVDFAGSTVVHSVGGWVALAALLIIGPRTGRFVDGKPQHIPGSNPTLALLGAMFFVIGWIGFNGGSTLSFNEAVPGIIINTIISAAAGGVSAYLLAFLNSNTKEDSLLIPINGVLAGLVGITASAHAVSTLDAFVIGASSALVMLLLDRLLIRFQVDDAIGAIPVHLGPGIWGTLCVAFFGAPEILETGLSPAEQLQVQLQGIIVIGLWAFLSAYLFLRVVNAFFPLRISRHSEHIGLNVSEHGAKTDLIELLSAMQQLENSTDLSHRVPVEPFTEVGQIASQHNRVMTALEQAVEQTQAIVRDIKDGILTCGSDGIITSVNPGAQQLFGYNEPALVGQPFFKLFHPDDPILHETDQLQDVKTGFLKINQKKNVMGLRAGEGAFHMEVAISEGHLADEHQYTVLVRDVTDKTLIEEELHQEREQALVTLESIVDGVITTNQYGLIEYLNSAAEHYTGWNGAAASGQRFNRVYRIKDIRNHAEIKNILEKPLNQSKPLIDTSTYLLESNDGRSHSIQHTAAPIFNKQNQVTGAVIVFHDVTETMEMQEQLSYQATHDALTGLMNRTAFEYQAAELINHIEISEEEHVLCYLDLDQFKLVNDTCGHFAGDELLRQVAHLMKSHLRKGDSFARLGGDEFGVLLHNCPIEHGLALCNDILEAVKKFRFPWEDKQFSIGVSIGVVRIGVDAPNLSQVLSWADTACYAAKDMGRNRVHLYEPNDIELAKRQGQMQWVTRIREALDKDRFRLYFQTIAPINDQRACHHYEIFIRMIDDNDNVIPPGAFIPAAERYNLMQEIDLWVIKNALAWLSDYTRKKPDSIDMCAINLSGSSIGDPTCLEMIKEYFNKYDMSPQLVCFEITETSAIANLRAATTFISDMKRIGCKFALDDFGSGLSSFGYLKNLQVDYLKIDGSFIKNIDKDSTDEAMVVSINSIGHVMGLKTIAEFVESKEIVDKLDEIGIDYIQGYYIDQPRPLEQLEGVVFMPR